MIKQMQIQKKQLEREKEESRNIINEMMKNYKEKQYYLDQEKSKLTGLEAQLVKKIRVVETIKNTNMKNTTKQNDW